MLLFNIFDKEHCNSKNKLDNLSIFVQITESVQKILQVYE